MLTPRYHYGTIIAVFLALGLGILLGGSLGQQWLSEKQQDLLTRLEEKYDEASKRNKQQNDQIKQLTNDLEKSTEESDALWREGIRDELKGAKIVFLKQTDSQFSPELINALQAAGSTVQITNLSDTGALNTQGLNMIVIHPDLIENEEMRPMIENFIRTYHLPVILLNTENGPDWLAEESLFVPVYPVNIATDEKVGSLLFVERTAQILEEVKAKKASLEKEGANSGG